MYKYEFSILFFSDKKRRGQTDLIEHVVCRHGELAEVEHQAFSHQGEQTMTQHDLGFSPDRGSKEQFA